MFAASWPPSARAASARCTGQMAFFPLHQNSGSLGVALLGLRGYTRAKPGSSEASRTALKPSSGS